MTSATPADEARIVNASGLRDVEARASEIVRAFDAQGHHRTGTPVDAASADWLAEQFLALGGAPEFERFSLDRLEPVRCELEIGGRVIAGVPAFDRDNTGPMGLSGTLGRLGSDAEIAVVSGGNRLTQGGKPLSADEWAELNNRYRGIVLVAEGDRPGITLQNAPNFARPFGPPVLQVSGSEASWIFARANAGSACKLWIDVDRKKDTASNVVVELAGRTPSRPPLIVSTPRSSWWESTAERGGGLAALVEVFRRFRDDPPAKPTIFAAFSGHELGLLGGEDFFARRPEIAAGKTLWLHFGANLGARGQGLRLQSNDTALAEHARDGLRAYDLETQIQPPDARPRGEAGIPYRAGITYLAPIASSGVFHHPDDRWPDAIDTNLVARCCAAFSNCARHMAEDQ